ncbi:CDP-diacylglycerol--glycerol-3-phosphate 3-phosphatidyltransferase [Paenibacillus marchantiae]|uniref:CDP-diacylglycerol--glycerol-3-phosphate 3-phosphatidyltransferase n=1 Tax=Paenibacillus TaxID=44249 RepID=UPI00088C5187|nr:MULTISPECIES: CDP-diacylglycerol--glycerol-3-phosphate 3-phosphatidyltransferase [Paenibacillus]WDQ35214.1 CDP-diacylglycerol--glycerol-3-phosphate 3-phosphatidyltransferase [Paenibacillus marchantiae]SDL84150.1 CDP-diacylglycerol--glycerol-3-phosphate 3-phosphatidyltransferase [Paenibacillus sp. OK060]
MNLANKITLARMTLIPLFMLCFIPLPSWILESSELIRFLDQHGLVIGVIIFTLAAGTDKLDGYVARKYNQITNLGKLLDPLADKLLISVALIMMVQENLIGSWIAVIIIGREIVITALRMIASEQGIALAADRYGKIKMVLQVAAIIAVLLNNFPFSLLTDVRVDMILLWLAAGVTLFSGLNYILVNYRLLK